MRTVASAGVSVAESLTLSATLTPADATVRILRWELLDDDSARAITLGRSPGDTGLSSMTGDYAVVTALGAGEARIRVTALGSVPGPDGRGVYEIVTVSVGDFGSRLAAVLAQNPPPASAVVETVMSEERLEPQRLYFGGAQVAITVRGRPAGGDALLLDDLGAMFSVGPGVTLTLEDIALYGMDGNDNALVEVVGGTLIMNDGASIAGNTNDTVPGTDGVYPLGGGVFLYSGTFVMRGGDIRGNASVLGGGVNSMWHGDIVMEGGRIFDNRSFAVGLFIPVGGIGGGVYSANEFLMSGGEIFGNDATDMGGGVVNDGGEFRMTGGAIRDNTAGAGGGVISGGMTGGGAVSGLFEMSHPAEIRGNRVTADGAGVYNGGVFNMRGGVIRDNVAGIPGGGVFNQFGGTFTMYGGAISGNTASGGAGVHSSGIFNMRGGVISRNTAEYATGGVHNSLGGIFRISDGIIFGADGDEDSNVSMVVQEDVAFSHNQDAVSSQFGTFDADGVFTPAFFNDGNIASTQWTVEVVGGSRLR